MSFASIFKGKILSFAALLMLTLSKLGASQNDLYGLPNISSRTESAWTLSADFLAWFASEEPSSIWADVITIGDNTSAWNALGFNLKWDYGFRLGAGYDLIYDQWDTGFYWTWFHTDAEHTIPNLPNGTISPEFFAAFLSSNSPESMSAKWGLLFNMFDWELGRSYWASENLSLRPFLGIKGGWIHQSIQAHYYNLTIDHVHTNNSAREHVKNNFWGAGPSGGIYTKWQIRHFGSHFFNFFGDFSVATMWGNWICADVYKNTISQTSSVNTKNSALGALMFRGFLGLGWDVALREGKSHMAAKLGYEMQFWSNQLRIATFQLQRLHGDLTLQGLTFNCRIDF